MIEGSYLVKHQTHGVFEVDGVQSLCVHFAGFALRLSWLGGDWGLLRWEWEYALGLDNFLVLCRDWNVFLSRAGAVVSVWVQYGLSCRHVEGAAAFLRCCLERTWLLVWSVKFSDLLGVPDEVDEGMQSRKMWGKVDAMFLQPS
jgi:hypothetical protein